MPYSESVLRRASGRLAARREEGQRAQDALRDRLYRDLPRVAEIDRALRKSVAHVVSATLRQGDDPLPAIRAIREENRSLQEERARLLLSRGFSEDAGASPRCPKCGDAGWVGAEMCDCLKALCAQEQIAELSQVLDLGEQAFDRFDFSYYTDGDHDGRGRSSRQKMQVVCRVCRDYADFFGRRDVRNLFLHGKTGLGKTFLSACIARVVSESGFSVVYDTAGSIFAQFETQKFSRDSDDSREARDGTRRYLGCDLLIMDDLGCEMTTPFVQSALYQLINTRLISGKHTVISSNLTIDDIRQRYTPQIASRLEGEYQDLPFFGADIRLQRKQR